MPQRSGKIPQQQLGPPTAKIPLLRPDALWCECGGGAVIWNQIRIGCANARNKGTCSNKHTIRRDQLEAAVLDGLQHHLMDPGSDRGVLPRVHRAYEPAAQRAHRFRGRPEELNSPRSLGRSIGSFRRSATVCLAARSRIAWPSWKRARQGSRPSWKDVTTPPPLLHPNLAELLSRAGFGAAGRAERSRQSDRGGRSAAAT